MNGILLVVFVTCALAGAWWAAGDTQPPFRVNGREWAVALPWGILVGLVALAAVAAMILVGRP